MCAAICAQAHRLPQERNPVMQLALTCRPFFAGRRLLFAALAILVCGSLAAYAATKVVTDKDNGGKVEIKTTDLGNKTYML